MRRGGGGVQLDRDFADLGGQLGADFVFHLFKGDVFVVLTQVCLGSWGEDWFRQLVGLLQAFRQLDAADRAGGLVVFPAGADDVAAYNRLHQDWLQALRHNGAAFHLLHFVLCHDGFRGYAGQVVGDDVAQFFEPEVGHLVQDHAFARDRLVHHDVERGQAVGGDD